MAKIRNTDESEEVWEYGTRERIFKFLCSVYHRNGITFSQTQGIMGEYAEADWLIDYLLKEKHLMKSNDRYEFTFKGLKEFMCLMLKYGESEMGKNSTQDTLIIYTRKEASKHSI